MTGKDEQQSNEIKKKLSDKAEIGDLLESDITNMYKNIGLNFEQLMQSLPENLCDFYQWFVPLPVSQDYQNYLRSHFSVRFGGPYARHLIKFGMTPETVLGATRSIQLLLEDCETSVPPQSHTHYHDNYAQLSIVLHFRQKNEDKSVFISQDHVLPYVVMTPLLPRDKALHFSFMTWFWEVLACCPHLIKGYTFESKKNNCLHFRKNILH